MKTSIYLAAALMLASGAAQAGSSIALNVNGHNIRITAPRSCQSLSCLQISGIDLKGMSSSKTDDDDDTAAAGNRPAPNTAAAAPAPAPAPVAAQPAAQANAQPQPSPNPPQATVAPPPPAPVAAAPQPAPAAPPPPTTVAAVAPAPAPAPAAAPAAAAPAVDPNSPLGLWATEGGKGNVRIEMCGQNLCGFAEKSGEKILINMKPKESKWVGRIHDPEGGGNYDSTIVLKGPNTLKVQGCAFGGLFCGGQTWKRIG